MSTNSFYALFNKASGRYYVNIGSSPSLAPRQWKESIKFPPQYSTTQTEEEGRGHLYRVQGLITDAIAYYAENAPGDTIIKRFDNVDLSLVKVTETITFEEIT